MVTKGPWYQVPTDFAVIVDRDPHLEDARVVARCWDNRWQTRSVYDEDYEAGRANARAIAACPLMMHFTRRIAEGREFIRPEEASKALDELQVEARAILRAVEEEK